ncbi:MAG: protein-export chaperone SecB [Bauldia sp.]|nr:protein-export chaperone SecB [Bauldia sp.]
MAEETTSGGNGQAAAPQRPAQQQPQNLGVLAQYVKDLSFENPAAPQSLRGRAGNPNIAITINVQPGPMSGDEVEVELRLDVKATSGEEMLFAIELVYAGLFRLTNIPADAVQPIIRIECPRLLFPFARQIIADASRNGGFPPLLIDPIDFVGLYRQRMMEAQAASQQAGGGGGSNLA